ncbi:hypothetical protein LJC53_03670 [Bacteroidales bacterium OttesenSCG-928-C03]|nr:hypothetical protein [Bacteroidales bacterium OttesenSCG-928-C03]MDL2325938.1 hypothetical protein [Bacteroidales bacterium OttesenSCG-928-A14]
MNDKNIYEQDFTIYSYLTDCNGYLAPKQLLSLMQEVAWAHVDKHNIGWDYLFQFNQFWALTRLHVKILRMPKWNEKIKIKTWGKLSEMLTHYRDHEVLDEDGNLIIAATSTWVILDFTTGRPQRVENLPTYLYVNEHRNAIVENAPKIKRVSFAENERVFQPVLFSDIDVNQHVNNSFYLQFAIDALDFDYVKNHRVSEIFLNFTWQAKAGDCYAVQSSEIAPDDIVSFIFSKEEGRELARVRTKWEVNG